MTEQMSRMRELATEVSTLERRYRALDLRLERAGARWDRPTYERAEAAQRALGTSEPAVRELARLMATWGLEPEDLAALDLSKAVCAEVRAAFRGWSGDGQDCLLCGERAGACECRRYRRES